MLYEGHNELSEELEVSKWIVNKYIQLNSSKEVRRLKYIGLYFINNLLR
jgi:hypothetical protein